MAAQHLNLDYYLNKIRSTKLVKEQLRPYDYKKISPAEFEFTTDSEVLYTVDMHIEEDYADTSGDYQIMRIEFANKTESGKWSHTDVVNRGELFSVMATIVKIAKDRLIKNPKVKTLNFTGAKSSGPDDQRRLKLYTAYVKKQFPKAEVELDGEEAIVYLPEGINEGIISEIKANTHLTHLEELILTQGLPGYKKARSFILELIKNLKGHSNAKVNTSVKWDGAPASICRHQS